MSSSDDSHFDASQYAFFGKDILEEVELGGLEEQENDETAPAAPDYEFHFSTEDKGLADTYASLSHVDDLSSTFAKLNRAASDPTRHGGLLVDRSSISRDSSSTLDWTQDTDYLSWPDPSQALATLCDPDTMIRRSHLSSSHQLSYSKPLLRTSSSPQQPPLHHHQSSLLADPNLARIASFQSQLSLNLTRHSSIPSLSSNHSSLSTLPHPPYGNYDIASLARNLSFASQGLNLNLPGLFNQQIQNHNSREASILLDSPHQLSVRSVLRPNVLSSWSMQQDPPHTSSGTGVSKFRSKYMSIEELESISRMVDSRAHGGDQYVKDYYHQACLSKRGVQSQFYPSSVRDVDTTTLTSVRVKDIHTILSSASAVGGAHMKRPPYTRPLEKEPMFAARILIDDCLALLLDIDDIDRVIQHSVPRNSVSELRKHRQILLERLAASLQLVDPLGSYVANPLNDDLVFLCIVSLPKGRELVIRYLRLIPLGTELARVVCMAVFRHLRALFGVMPAEKAAAETVSNLAKTVSRCVHSFEISALSACLAAVVCSSEQPPLRPIGSSAGNGASVALKSVLNRATNLLSNPIAPTRYFMSTINLWRASFDAFFTLLMSYCISKFESIVQQFFEPSAADMANTIGREMPVELLHSILPHTNENQRKVLLDFVQRCMPAGVPVSSESLLD